MSSHSLDVLTSLSVVVPAPLVVLAESWDPETTPAEARLAASVVLCRDGSDGLETYLLHRHARMAFAASMAVFPGGGVDPADGSGPVADTADRLLACAIRETREETGLACRIVAGLGEIRYRKSRKTVIGFLAEPLEPVPEPVLEPGDWEVDRAEFLLPDDARTRLHPDQRAFIDRALALNASGGVRR